MCFIPKALSFLVSLYVALSAAGAKIFFFFFVQKA